MTHSAPLVLPCPAKLNLFLLITGRRPDGYHTLQTLFQILDYGDELQLKLEPSGQIQLTPSFNNIPQEQNLVYQAAQLLKNHSQTPLGANLHLTKRLPMGGGIGGGSSDAATALLGLNHLWNTHLPIDELAELGRQLGADVPVFVRGNTAWAEGLGEALTPMQLNEKWYLVLNPDCHVSTKTIFCRKELTRNSKHIKMRAFLEEGGVNDCQPVVEKLFPQVKDAVDWLGQFGPAQMSGTGACVFAPFESQLEALAVFAKRPKQLNGFIAKGVNESPLHRLLNSVATGV